MRTRVLTDAWASALADWTIALRSAGRAETTIKTRVEHLSWLASRASDRTPWSLSGEDLVVFTGTRTWARETHRGVRNSLRGFFSWAHGTGRMDTNPALLLARIAPSHNRRHPAPDDALFEAWLAADPRERLMLRLANELGLRRAEVAAIHSNDLVRDLYGWSLIVHGKGGRERLLRLTPDLASAVERATAEAGWAFPGRCDGHLSLRWFGKLMTRLLPSEVTMHQLRHRFPTITHQETGNTRLVQELLVMRR